MSAQIAHAKALAASEESAFTHALAYARSYVVADDPSYEGALEDIRHVKARSKALKAKASELIDPLKGVIAAIESEIDPRLDAAKEIERVLKEKCAAYKVALERENARRRTEAQAALTERRAMPEHVASLANTAPKVQGVTTRKVFRVKVTNPAIVPERFRVWYIDEKAVLADVEATSGKTPIPGIEITEDYIIGVKHA